ncbi:hypothetical protein NEFER01_0368 [Nematocida sp. LUAm1]|nr:hypothetical protein NEFER02_1883 [Nematocida sp. LUAm2]KAI5177093.1 hypothetical protein NEFER01_0368 [Nematocida sp. LUAm1]
MASSNTNETKKAVAKKVNETDNKAHEHLKSIKQSKVGKYIPTEYDRLTTKNVALLGFIVMCFISMYMYMFCFILAGIDIDDITRSIYPSSFSGILMAGVFIIGLAHDAFVYFMSNGHLLLSFLGLRLASLVVTVMALASISGASGGFMFKFILLSIYTLFTLIYTYVFSIFISEIKHSIGGANISDHQAV